MVHAGQRTGDRRFVELDGVRAIAVVMVVVGHFTVTYDTLYGARFPWPAILNFARFGVQLFFLVSGFVILLSVQRIARPSDFLITRFARLFPAYWVAVTWSILVAVILHPRDVTFSWVDRLLNYSMVQRFIGAEAVDTVFWTLAIELQFYGLMFLLILVTRCRPRPVHIYLFVGSWLVLVSALTLAFSGRSRGYSVEAMPGSSKILFNIALVEYAPLFCTGMLAWLARAGKCGAWPATFAGVAVAVTQAFVMHDIRSATAIAVICAIFLGVCAAPSVSLLRSSPVQWVGRRSYSLYLVHNVTGLALMHALGPVVGWPFAMLLAVAVTLGLAHVLYEVVEIRLSTRVRARLTAWRDARDPVPVQQ